MFVNFILSLIAGFLASRSAETFDKLLGKLESATQLTLRLSRSEKRILAFGLLLVLAAILTAISGRESSAFLSVIGGLLGYFGLDLYGYARDPDRATIDDPSDWDGGVPPLGERGTVDDRTAPEFLSENSDVQATPDTTETLAEAETDAEQTLRAVSDALQVHTDTPEPKDGTGTSQATDEGAKQADATDKEQNA